MITTRNDLLTVNPNAPELGGLHLRLPATSANLGPGFDTLALALSLNLEIHAKRSAEFSLKATGRNPDICSSLRRNLMLDVYQKTLAAHQLEVIPLSLEIHNEIPIGMGCGSSAAVRLAGVAMANYFGRLGMTGDEILVEGCRLEGHPDNAAACWLGGFTVAAGYQGNAVAVQILPATPWQVLLVMPDKPLATAAARAVLPASYGREDAVFNIQRSSLLTAAFATGRGDLLRVAMQDRIHQPCRGEICPLLARLLPMTGDSGVLGVALSGAGPSVLLLVDAAHETALVRQEVLRRAFGISVEMLECQIEMRPAAMIAETLT